MSGGGDVTPQGGLTAIAVALLTGGSLKYAVDVVRDWRRRRASSTPETRQTHLVDANLLTVAKARDELAEDLASARQENDRLRATMAQQEDRHAAREAQLRGEIEHLETKLRALLDELMSLKSRHGLALPE